MGSRDGRTILFHCENGMSTIDFSIEVPELFLRLGSALLAGVLLGWERESHSKPAGLRTHMLVAMGSATFTIIAFEMYDRMQHTDRGPGAADPIRLLQGIIGGIGFLGAGSIIRDRASVTGLTTAANIWVTGGIGVACGGGLYLLAGSVTGLALLTLIVIGWFEKRVVYGKDTGTERPAAGEEDGTAARDIGAGGAGTG